MKKLFITLIAVLAMSFSAKAQFYVGGSFGLRVFSVSGSTSSSFVLSPEFGYDFNDKIAAGGLVELAVSPFAFNVNPYFRWKFAKINTTKFFTDVMASLGSSNDTFVWGATLRPGISFDITRKVSFVTRVAALGVQGTKDSTAFDFILFNGATIGVFYHF